MRDDPRVAPLLESERAGLSGWPVFLGHSLPGGSQVRCHLFGEEAAETHVQDGAEADELVDVHRTLAVEHVPEPLAVHSDSPAELGHADAAVLSGPLHPRNYEVGVVHPSPRSENFFRVSENSDCQFFRISVNLINWPMHRGEKGLFRGLLSPFWEYILLI